MGTSFPGGAISPASTPHPEHESLLLTELIAGEPRPSPFPVLTTSMAMPMRHPRSIEHHRVQWRRNVRDDGKELRGNRLGHKARYPGQLPAQCPAPLPLPLPSSPPSPSSTYSPRSSPSPPSQPPSITHAHHPWDNHRPIHWTSLPLAPFTFTDNLTHTRRATARHRCTAAAASLPHGRGCPGRAAF